MNKTVLLTLVVLGAILAFFLLRDAGESEVFTQEESRLIAQSWVETMSPTYTFDGMDLTLVKEEVRIPDVEYEFIFAFDSRAAGYGDRADEMSAQVITPHEIRVVVTSGVVTSALTDGVFDELTTQMIEVPAVPTGMTVQVFFVEVVEGEERVVARERDVVATVAIGRAALEALLAGPTEAELAEGLTTAINDGVILQDLVIADGVAAADFNTRLGEGVAGSAMVTTIRSQIEQTLLQFDTVTDVIISINGETEEVLQP